MNTASLKLPTGNLKGQKVALVYAPERGQPSPLLQLKINDRQRCQIKIYKFGLEIATEIGLKIFNDYMSEKVHIDDIYSHRNALEENALQRIAAEQQPETAAGAPAPSDAEEMERPIETRRRRSGKQRPVDHKEASAEDAASEAEDAVAAEEEEEEEDEEEEEEEDEAATDEDDEEEEDEEESDAD